MILKYNIHTCKCAKYKCGSVNFLKERFCVTASRSRNKTLHNPVNLLTLPSSCSLPSPNHHKGKCYPALQHLDSSTGPYHVHTSVPGFFCSILCL